MIRDYVALDLEMTGLSPRKDAILEIGAVKVRDMEVTETYTAMVNPGFPGSGAGHELTGITTEMAQQGRGNPHSIAGISGILWTIRDPWA